MRRFWGLAVGLAAVLTFTPVFAGLATGHGYDVSWPQCGTALPSDGDFRIVGVTGGKPYTNNDCLGEQYQWAKGAGGAAFYINTANPGTASQAVDWYNQKSPNKACSTANEAACAYNYGYNGAAKAWSYAQSQTGAARRHSWWLDVETMNSWSRDHDVNLASIVGALKFLRAQNVPVGVYSTDYQWGVITGGARMAEVPNWVAGARNGNEAATWCGPDSSFTGGQVILVQWVQNNLDHNHACAPLPAVVRPAPGKSTNLIEALLQKLLRDLGLAK